MTLSDLLLRELPSVKGESSFCAFAECQREGAPTGPLQGRTASPIGEPHASRRTSSHCLVLPNHQLPLGKLIKYLCVAERKARSGLASSAALEARLQAEALSAEGWCGPRLTCPPGKSAGLAGPPGTLL